MVLCVVRRFSKKLIKMGYRIKMKFKDAPIGARFNFIGDDAPKDIYILK